MDDIQMHLIKNGILELMESYMDEIKVINNESDRDNKLKNIWSLNRTLQLIDVMEQRIIGLNAHIQSSVKAKTSISDYRVIAIEQSSKIDNLNKTIVELVGKLDKFGGV